jgi:hypothetical protein
VGVIADKALCVSGYTSDANVILVDLARLANAHSTPHKAIGVSLMCASLRGR